MAVIKCKMCGGDLALIQGESTAECEYCGTLQTVPQVDDEKKLTLFTRANRLRAACEFDKAAGIYETIVADFPQEAEAYWGLVLCKYGIEYVDDPATAKKIPTCHRSSFDSVMDDSDFELVMENADAVARRVYREEAKHIEEIRRGIIAVSSNEEPYDIFICYKETGENGERTIDSVLAQDLYDALTAKGYRVFFARITLEDKLGLEYEPYIFAALTSARIMLAVGTDYEYYNAVWVKNEWSRFLKLMAKDKDKHLIPCFKGIDAYDIPKDFGRLQAQDLGKVGAIQDLLRGIEKLMPQATPQATVQQIVQQPMGSAAEPLLKRMMIFLEDGDMRSADEYAEKVLDMDPENAQAYLGKLMARLGVRKQSDLPNLRNPFDGEPLYAKVLRYSDPTLGEELKNAVQHIKDRNETNRQAKIYAEAIRNLNAANNNKNLAQMQEQFLAAAKLFGQIPQYHDATQKQEMCKQMAEVARKNDLYRLAEQMMQHPTLHRLIEAKKLLTQIPGWKNSDEMLAHCSKLISEKQARLNEEHNAKRNEMLWTIDGRCRHCGGEFKGMIKKVCENCGKPKDY